MLVVDASVATKWFLVEADSVEAIQLLSSNLKLVGPVLAKYEVAGAITRRARDQQILGKDALSYRDRWLHAVATNVMRLEDDQRDVATGHEIAMKLSHVLPDCVYLAMALRLAVPLVTADNVFAKKAKKHYENVLTINDALSIAA